MDYTDAALLAQMRRGGFMRGLAALIVIAFTMLILTPAVVAARQEMERPQSGAAQQSEAARMAATLQALESKLERFQQKMAQSRYAAEEEREIRELHGTLRGLDKAVRNSFRAIENQLRGKKLPPLIMERHQKMVDTYHRELTTTLQELEELEQATDPETRERKLKAAYERITRYKHQRDHQPFDPAAPLPHQRLKGSEDNKPKVRSEQFSEAGLHDNPYPRLAAVGSFMFDAVPGADDPVYLSDTPEVTLTQAIKDKAEELNHDPVGIYHWVRNHIEWSPSWGAVQSAELTLSSRRGNAMDIASLTIALLRASGIPARYVHGTIDVGPDEFRNWTGGFENLNEAMTYASSGGIPVTGMVSGGKVVKVRMEHVWVEAALDYFPSRAAINREADSWVAMGPSFKQYEYQEGLDVAEIAGLDGEALAQSFLDSGTLNEEEGWVQGFDPAVIQGAQQQARAALEAHIENMDDPTVGDVIGGRKVIVKEFPGVPSSLPNPIVVEGVRYGELPDKLRPELSLGFTDLLGTLTERVSFAWAAVNNRKVTLSFKPATAADEEALASLLPEGEITDISQLPDSIPAYLIEVVPQIKVDGEVKLSGKPMSLGEDLGFAFEVSDPVHGPQVYPSPVVAGSFLSIAVVGGSVAPWALTDAQARLEETRSTLESEDEALIAGLTREDILGDMFHAGTLGYFAEYTALAHMAALQQGSHFQLAPSVGTYGYVPQVNYLFGMPRSIEPGGVEMDLDRVAHAGSVDGKGEEAGFHFTFQLGALASALEHAIPEQMFVSEDNPGEAVSAVKALQKAGSQDQRIYHITSENQTWTLPNVHHNSATMQEIQQALAVGKEVITHTDAIAVPGWTGAGYVIFDPDVGDGAWKIGGGANGGVIKLLEDAQALFWGILDTFGSETLKLVAKAKMFIDHVINIMTLVANCPSGNAVAAIVAITLIAVGFIVLAPAFAAVGLVAALVYSIFSGSIVGLISFAWIDRCTRSV